MKTKNIFKALALAMLLTTACVNNEIPNENGYALPVTINVTRQGNDPATRATYTDNGDGTGSLAFSTGDQLFVFGSHETAGIIQGTLTWQSGGTFSGTLTTENLYDGTAQELLESAPFAGATLLPADYDDYGYFYFEPGTGFLLTSSTNAFATSKATAVAQFSREQAKVYSSGFALEPSNAILNFTISGLTPGSHNVEVYGISGAVTANGSGVATFAVGVDGDTYSENINLTVDSDYFDLNLYGGTNTPLEAGKIYNITRSALTYPIALSAVTSSYVGGVVTTDGNVYATVAAASAASKTAVAVIAYVGTAGSVDASSATYKGLAVALSDANSGSKCKWADGLANCLSSQTDAIATALGFKNGITCTSTLTAAGHSSHGHAAATAAASNNSTDAPTGTSGWFMPSMGQWNLIVQGLATKKAGSAVTTDLEKNTNNDTYKADNLNSVITDAGGTGFQEDSYWASTEETTGSAWVIDFWGGYAKGYSKNNTNHYVRSIIAF